MSKIFVYILTIENEYGVLPAAFYDEETLYEDLYDYVAENWDDERYGKIKRNHRKAVDRYFEVRSEGFYDVEYYRIDYVEVKGKRPKEGI